MSPWIQDVKKGNWTEVSSAIKTWNPPQRRKKDGTWVDNYTRREKEVELFSNCTY